MFSEKYVPVKRVTRKTCLAPRPMWYTRSPSGYLFGHLWLTSHQTILHEQMLVLPLATLYTSQTISIINEIQYKLGIRLISQCTLQCPIVLHFCCHHTIPWHHTVTMKPTSILYDKLRNFKKYINTVGCLPFCRERDVQLHPRKVHHECKDRKQKASLLQIHVKQNFFPCSFLIRGSHMYFPHPQISCSWHDFRSIVELLSAKKLATTEADLKKRDVPLCFKICDFVQHKTLQTLKGTKAPRLCPPRCNQTLACWQSVSNSRDRCLLRTYFTTVLRCQKCVQ